MSVTTLAPEQVVSQGRGRLANFRLIPRIDTYPRAIEFAKTPAGKLVLLALFGLGLAYSKAAWWPLIPWLLLITLLPNRRRMLVTAATLTFTFMVPLYGLPESLYGIVFMASAIGLGAMLFWATALWPRSWYGKRPVIFLLSGYSALVLFASRISPTARYYPHVWQFATVLSTYVWFIGYSLLDRKSTSCDPLSLQLGTYRPFWGSTQTPIPKGAAYLRRIEARDAGQLAVTQLKGLKLLVWSILISLFSQLFARCVHGYLRIPAFSRALALSTGPTPLPWYLCWASLIAGFLETIMSFSIWGHRFVACCRMAGFNALRNTYRPLSSRTVAQFFNRFYYYFKELLVDFFFYPMFLKHFKKSGKFRTVAAIFAAACFGNAYYHFFRDLNFIQELGLVRALAGYQVYLFYCVVLATAISISNLRHRAPAPKGFLRGQLWPSFCVGLFYCLLEVFDSTERNCPLAVHFRFLAHLFNLRF
ncbi:MAG TPA: hypothetical protein VEH50_04680 [Methylomirabilota bacterium]|nr:hypothetical protein [Methylomirabilota bacterium]